MARPRKPHIPSHGQTGDQFRNWKADEEFVDKIMTRGTYIALTIVLILLALITWGLVETILWIRRS